MDFKHKNHLISSYLTLQEQLQENISDISPEVFERKFGALDPEERAHIKEVIDRILQELKEAQQLV